MGLFSKMSHGSSLDSSKSSYQSSKAILICLTSLFSLSNFILFVMSAVAWCRAKKRTLDTDCPFGEHYCGLNRWAAYPFLTFSALICCISSGIMAFRALRVSGSPLDCKALFRGVFFATLILAAITCIGWSHPGDSHDTPKTGSSSSNHPGQYDISRFHRAGFGTITGTFILELLDTYSRAAKPALYTLHFNLAFGVFLTAMCTALAPLHRAQPSTGIINKVI